MDFGLTWIIQNDLLISGSLVWFISERPFFQHKVTQIPGIRMWTYFGGSHHSNYYRGSGLKILIMQSCMQIWAHYLPFLSLNLLNLKTGIIGTTWVVQRLSVSRQLRVWSWILRIESHSGLPAWNLLLSLPMALPLSLSLCLSLSLSLMNKVLKEG